MQISSNYNLPVVFNDRIDAGQRQASQQQKKQQLESELLVAQQESVSALPGNQAVFLQPLFDQRASHRGEQAMNTYRDVALTGESELLNRLDVIA